MDTYRLTDSNGNQVEVFEARHNGEAIDRANELDRLNALTGSTLWVRQHNGDWLAI